MSRSVFIDTAGWWALINRRDQLHTQAVEVYRRLGGAPRFTTDAVLIETCNVLSRVALRPLALALTAKIREAEELKILHVAHATGATMKREWQLFKFGQTRDGA